MMKAWTNVMAGAAALVTLALAQTGRADDFIARDRRGNLTVHDDRAGFGAEGQWAFSTDTGLSIQRTTVSNQDGSVTTLSLVPAIDYFVLENLSVGGVMGVEYQKAGGDRRTNFRLGPRVGYNFELSELLSVWPKLGFSFSHSKYKQDFGIDDATAKSNAIALNLSAPLMVHPAAHFFAGFGPFLDTELSGDNRNTTWGFKLTLGGWV